MGDGDIWYFLKGRETVGPFSREILRQIHKDGQLTPETLVWREGLEGWKPAREVPELEIPNTNAPPPPSVSASPENDKPKLKLKNSTPTASPSPSPLQIPALKMKEADRKPSPSSDRVVSISAPALRFPAPNEKNAEAQKSKPSSPPFLKRILGRIFSSLVMTPLFLIAVAALVYLHQHQFPNVLWVIWLVVGFGMFGALSLVGIHSLDGTFRHLAILMLAPPLVLFWPVLIREVRWQDAPPAHWIFLGFCFLYLLTMRVGLSNYLGGGLAGFGTVTGLLALAFAWLATCTPFAMEKIPGWPALVAKGDSIRLPGVFARMINMPQWGTEVGNLTLLEESAVTRHGLESAEVQQRDHDWMLVMRTLDGIYLAAKLTTPEGKLDPAALIGKDCPILFSKEAVDDPGSGSSQLKLPGGESLEVSSATLRLDKVEGNLWQGSLRLQIANSKKPQNTSMTGSFKTAVTQP